MICICLCVLLGSVPVAVDKGRLRHIEIGNDPFPYRRYRTMDVGWYSVVRGRLRRGGSETTCCRKVL